MKVRSDRAPIESGMAVTNRLAGPPLMIMCAYMLALVALGCGRGDDRAYSRESTALVAHTQGLDAAAVYIQAQLRRVGVEMDVQVLDEDSADERIWAGEFEAAVFIFYNENVFHHLRFFGDDSPIAYSHPRVSALLQAAEATWNPNEVDGAYRDLWPIFQEDLPVTFLSPVVWTGVAHRRIQGLSSPWRTDPVRNMDDLWLEDDDP